jgi:hypothetical protein
MSDIVDTEKATLNPKSCQLVDLIFGKFLLLCRGFDSLYSDINRLKAEKTLWFSYFTKHGITEETQVRRALERLETWGYANPPQLGLFMTWCKPSFEEMGFPSVERAYLISLKLNQQFAESLNLDAKVETVIRHAINQIDALTYRMMPATEAKKAFSHYYMVALRQFEEGELKLIEKALPEKANNHPVDREKADKARVECLKAISKIINYENKRAM